MMMVFKTLVLLLMIFVSFSFVFLRILAAGSENNFFNSLLRDKFAVYPLLRSGLGLNFDGDAKSDYLGSDYKEIIVELDMMEGITVSDRVKGFIRDYLALNTGKKVTIVESSRIPFSESVSDLEIEPMVETYRNYFMGGARVYLLFLNRYEDKLDHLGSTYHEYGILIYHDALKEFTKDSPQTYDYYTASTVLHEFGHQLGLPHNSYPACLMNDYVQTKARALPEEVVMDFCSYEKQLIKAY